MKEILLNNGMVAVIDDEDFELCAQFTWCAIPGESCRPNWYANAWTGGKSTFMHRLILNVPRGVLVDHRDGDGLRNVRQNLRIATRSQNNVNRVYTSKSGFRGVDPTNGKFVARIEIGGQVRRLGRFLHAEDAARAYDEAALELFGEFAVLNFPRKAA